MRNRELIACAGLFLLLTALRFCFPTQLEQVRTWAAQAIDPAGRCGALALSIGQGLDSLGLKDGLVVVFRLGEEALG